MSDLDFGIQYHKNEENHLLQINAGFLPPKKVQELFKLSGNTIKIFLCFIAYSNSEGKVMLSNRAVAGITGLGEKTVKSCVRELKRDSFIYRYHPKAGGVCINYVLKQDFGGLL